MKSKNSNGGASVSTMAKEQLSADDLPQMTTTQLGAALQSGKVTPDVYGAEIARRLDDARTAGERAGRAKASNVPFSVETGSYKGADTLTFKGPFKPWTKGANAIGHLLKNVDQVTEALDELGIDYS